jgi:hypothetical protein
VWQVILGQLHSGIDKKTVEKMFKKAKIKKGQDMDLDGFFRWCHKIFEKGTFATFASVIEGLIPPEAYKAFDADARIGTLEKMQADVSPSLGPREDDIETLERLQMGISPSLGPRENDIDTLERLQAAIEPSPGSPNDHMDKEDDEPAIFLSPEQQQRETQWQRIALRQVGQVLVQLLRGEVPKGQGNACGPCLVVA